MGLCVVLMFAFHYLLEKYSFHTRSSYPFLFICLQNSVPLLCFQHSSGKIALRLRWLNRLEISFAQNSKSHKNSAFYQNKAFRLLQIKIPFFFIFKIQTSSSYYWQEMLVVQRKTRPRRCRFSGDARTLSFSPKRTDTFPCAFVSCSFTKMKSSKFQQLLWRLFFLWSPS